MRFTIEAVNWSGVSVEKQQHFPEKYPARVKHSEKSGKYLMALFPGNKFFYIMSLTCVIGVRRAGFGFERHSKVNIKEQFVPDCLSNHAERNSFVPPSPIPHPPARSFLTRIIMPELNLFPPFRYEVSRWSVRRECRAIFFHAMLTQMILFGEQSRNNL